MFLKNKAHLQTSIFGIQAQLSDAKRRRLEQSAESSFYTLVFNSIREEDFRPLFSEVDSRPNAPVNTLVSSILFKRVLSLLTPKMSKNNFMNDFGLRAF